MSAARGRAVLATVLAIAAAGLLAGCGGGGGAATGSPPGAATVSSQGSETTAGSAPAATPTPSAAARPSPAAITRADRTTHELPTPHGRQRVDGGWATPTGAVESFASAYINWTAATVAPRLRALARASVGQARAAVTAQASEVARDGELRRGGIANAGTVEAIGPVAGARDRYAVVTRERTTAASSAAYRGLRPAWHVALATVTRLPGGLWVLSAWQPEN